MSEVTVYLNGRSYDIACDTGQEGRVADLATYVDQKLQKVSRGSGAYSEANLMVLTAIVLADEIYELKAQGATKAPATSKAAASAAPVPSKDDEELILRVLEHMTQRIDGIVNRVQDA